MRAIWLESYSSGIVFSEEKAFTQKQQHLFFKIKSIIIHDLPPAIYMLLDMLEINIPWALDHKTPDVPIQFVKCRTITHDLPAQKSPAVFTGLKALKSWKPILSAEPWLTLVIVTDCKDDRRIMKLQSQILIMGNFNN
ncbi:hypothetical protein KIN20_016999 [Parelaphostrongylus tenuis]|uniref:Uncharacterized protein n=1 Tax=Parelaphostrongylus tenuis TaxID=148309 RepID=A0AAD5N2K6_PARTN|nr:hypothetical protein KIN20_016999 [Parelaphostrongylus tenuis]